MIPLPSDGSVSVAGRTPRLDVEAVEAVVTLPTFKRPEQVLETLASLRAQQTGRRFAVIVMENEAEARAGAKAALPLFERGEMSGLVIIAHERGNCSAYNAGWQTAILQFPNFRHLLVIDDDEIADPQWLERMCRAAETLSADIVGGPQVPVFADPAHARWA
ncbi:glycosyltransferase, partial [Mesorhizobium sp. M7A.F.Ca.CA.004.11.2.1]